MVKKIKNNMVIIMIISLINMLLVFLFYQGDLIIKREVYGKNIEHGMTKCAEVANGLDNIIYLGENIVNFIDRDYQYLSDTNNLDSMKEMLINQTFELINQNEKYFENLYIGYDQYVFSAENGVYENFSPVGRPWFESALERDGLVITSPYEDFYTGETVITISKRIGNTDGVVGLDILQTKILEMLKRETESADSIKLGFIINRDGIIIARTDGEHTGKSVVDSSLANADKLEPYYEQLLKDDSGTIMFDQEGYAYGLVHQKTASDWQVVYVVDKEVMSSETMLLRRQFEIYFVISFLLLNSVVIVYNYKRHKAIKLKERAENAEKNLLEHKKQLENLVNERTEKILLQSKKLEELNTAVIDNLADVVEFRDLESGQHIKRMKNYVEIVIKKAIELYPEYASYQDKIGKICEASALHDIGKIGISDLILLKPGKLTIEEFEEIKKHTIIGGELAAKILEKYDADLKEFGYQICRYHHERYDGKGYPDGLKNEDIPFCAQVVGIVDVYDALIEKRVYKKPFSHEKAIEMIVNGECGKFSEKIINTLLLVEDELKAIGHENN